MRRERGSQSVCPRAYIVWAWEPRQELSFLGISQRESREQAVSNDWESHFPTIFSWVFPKGMNVYVNKAHPETQSDTWMRLGLQPPVPDNHATLQRKPFHPHLLNREHWAFLNVFSGSISASNLMTDMGHGILESFLHCFPLCFHFQIFDFTCDMFTLWHPPQQGRNEMRTNWEAPELINSEVTKRKGPPCDWTEVLPSFLSQNSLRKYLFLPSRKLSPLWCQLPTPPFLAPPSSASSELPGAFPVRKNH